MHNALLAPSSPFIVGPPASAHLTHGEGFDLEVQNLLYWLDGQIREQGKTSASFRDREQFHRWCYAEVLQQTYRERAEALASVLAEAVGQLWLCLLAGSPLTTQRAAA